MTTSTPFTGISDLETLLASLKPVLNAGEFAFISAPDGRVPDTQDIVAAVREPEGLSLVVPVDVAARLGATILFRAAWITLTVHSDLQAVGLTAAFSRALADVGIGCNVIAGAYHDHIFVPHDRAAAAMAVLVSLSSS